MTTFLDAEDVARFERCGFVAVPSAFPAEVALSMQDAMWRELHDEFGIDREDRSSWRQPPRDLRRSKTDPDQRAMNTERLLGTCNELLQVGRWEERASWGRPLVTFPERSGAPWVVPTNVWHWDCELADNVGPVERLVVFTFFSNVASRGGGTLVVEGSHRLLRLFFGELAPRERRLAHRKTRKRFLEWEPWLKRLCGREALSQDRNTYFMSTSHEVRGVRVRVVELTGAPGDAVICHPLILHASSPNHADWPRFMRIKFPGQSSRTDTP